MIYKALIYKLIFLAFLLVSGCTPNRVVNKTVNYQIENFKLHQFRSDGDKLFDFATPKAVIDDKKGSIKSLKTLITLFKQEKELYDIESDTSTLLNNGRLVILDGNVIFTDTKKEDIRITSNNLKWVSADSTIYMTGSVVATMKSSTLHSKYAIYEIDEDKITFTEITSYDTIPENATDPKINVNSDKAIWFGETNKLQFISDQERVKSKIFMFN